MATFKFRRIAAKKFNDAEVKRLIRNAVFRVGRGVKKDFEKTIKTWDTKPDFSLSTEISATSTSFEVVTHDQKYAWVNNGTEGNYPIAARNKKVLSYQVDFTPKTQSEKISSNQGGKFGDFNRPMIRVYHSGIEAREFDKTIAKKWEKIFRQEVSEAIKEGLALSGHAK